MKNLIKILLSIVILIFMAVQIFLYLNQHMYYRAYVTSDPDEKIRLLEKAESLFPYNDLVYYEMGNSFLELGLANLGDVENSRGYLDRAIENYKDSIRINPASQFSHFQLARAIFNRNIVSDSADQDYISEYQRAARRVTYSSQIYSESAKYLLSRWEDLGDQDKRFTLEMMREIFERSETENIRSLLQVWYLNAKDYAIIERVLPETTEIYRLYADFLGERSLSLQERHKWLVRAEALEFRRAGSAFNAGMNAYFYYRLDRAEQYFESCLKTLDRIRFYQKLTSLEEPIPAADYDELRKSVLLNLAKCQVGMGKELQEFEGHLRGYLSYDPIVYELTELEEFLIDHGVIGETLETDYKDLDRLAFQLQLFFKQSKYQDIMRINRMFRSSTLLVSPEEREAVVMILQTLGDVYDKNHSLYDSGDMYRLALDYDPSNVETLLKLRDNYERLSQLSNVRATDRRIESLLSQRVIRIRNPLILGGEGFSSSLQLDGRDIEFIFQFDSDWGGNFPLITVVLNGRVVWEGYLEADSLRLPYESRFGKNIIQVSTVNRPVRLLSLTWRSK